MVNKVILIGFMGKDPEVRFTSGGQAVASLRVATSRGWTDRESGERKEETEWHDVEVWGKAAEACGEYLAKGGVFCPSCLRASTGLAPSDADYNGRPILPLYACDSSVQDECCTHCEASLLELRLAAEGERAKRAPAFRVEKTRNRQRQPALRFDRRPPPEVLKELKAAGWRWDPAAGLWWWPKGAPVLVPASLRLPSTPATVTARLPTIRKGAALVLHA